MKSNYVTDCCVITFAAYCQRCPWWGAEHDNVHDTVTDAQGHNLDHSHRTDVHGYAHVRVVHHHEVGVTNA